MRLWPLAAAANQVEGMQHTKGEGREEKRERTGRMGMRWGGGQAFRINCTRTTVVHCNIYQTALPTVAGSFYSTDTRLVQYEYRRFTFVVTCFHPNECSPGTSPGSFRCNFTGKLFPGQISLQVLPCIIPETEGDPSYEAAFKYSIPPDEAYLRNCLNHHT